MANQVNPEVWILDSTGSVYEPHVKVKTFIWETPDNQGDALILKNQDGDVILSAVCEADGQSQILRMGKWFHGLVVDTIDSGTLYVYFN